MLLGGEPFYTYTFGSMGRTLETARSTEFFLWFHLEEIERRPEPPGEVARFRPSGDKFRDLCYLDILLTGNGELVRMELVLRRSFLDGPDGLFAQDAVKSFLHAALPDACRYLLGSFIEEITTPGGSGETPGFLVFRGEQNAWEKETGWSRLRLANLPLPEGASLVVQLGPNPGAPNATRVEAARR